jgi:YD repeat-containing protein
MQKIAYERSVSYKTLVFKLTTAEKFVYVIDQTGGVQTITDANGNVLSFTANGITHSAGLGVVFTRDANGRITQITDPNNKTMTYAYNAAGDLVSVTDRENRTTQFTYDTQHNLKTIVDPSGLQHHGNAGDAPGFQWQDDDVCLRHDESVVDQDARCLVCCACDQLQLQFVRPTLDDE